MSAPFPTFRWLFADQLGPHFLDEPETDRVLLVESVNVFRRRRFHRRKAHLVLSALRHRAAELEERAVLVQADTYRQAIRALHEQIGPHELTVCAPTSRVARTLVVELEQDGLVEMRPERGWVVTPQQFGAWVRGRGSRRLLMDDFYREVRRATGLLVDAGGGPVGGRWSLDEENRQPPPRRSAQLSDTVTVGAPWWPVEDEIDAQVREQLDRWQRDNGVTFVGDDGPRRFAVTRGESLAALESFVTGRLDAFGPYEDAMLSGDRWMAHSMLSAPLNLGLLHPLEVARRAVVAWQNGDARLASVEGFVRQVVGWREYVWHLYWHFGTDYRASNKLDAHQPLPRWWKDLDAHGEVKARCLSEVMTAVREDGWTHHIPRLMVLGNFALQRGYDPAELTEWFHLSFADGYDWVMLPNVVGMSQHADGGLMATKPYVAGGAYINKMSDFCGGCPYDPKKRVGADACPFTAGYWAFLHRNREVLAGNHRMSQPLSGLARLTDLEGLLEQENLPERDAP